MSRNSLLLERVKKSQVLTPLGMPTPVRAPLSSLVRKEGFPREEITQLVQRLFLERGHARGPAMLCFCGMAHDDRSSWICARAAEYLASKVDASVCLVDADFLSPQLHAHFALRNQPGFAAALAGNEPLRHFVTSVCSTNLWLIPSGSLQPGSGRLEERVRHRFAELRKEFDYVFVSGPALSNESDAILLGKLSDGIVMIVETGWTRQRLAERTKCHLHKAEVKVLGTVLDEGKRAFPDSLYQRIRSLGLFDSLTGRRKRAG